MGEKDKPSPPNSGPGATAPATSPVQTCPAAQQHARLRIIQVTFSAGNHVDNDTFGNFPVPHWKRGRAADPAPAKQLPAQFPYCYERGKKVTLTPVFEVTQSPDATESVHVDGVATVGGVTLKFAGDVSVSPANTQVSASAMTSDVALPNAIAKYDPFIIDWFQTPCDIPRTGCGSSASPLYATYGTPAQSPLYWTLLEISCTAAHSKTTVADLRTESYGAMRTRAVNRKRDGRGLTYWNPDTTVCTNTQLLLASSDGSGQCGSWAELLIDMWKAHGDVAAVKVMIAQNIPAYPNSAPFLVKNWTFRGPPPADPKTLEYALVIPPTAAPPPPARACIEQTGVPGQRNPNPPPAFQNHFIVLVGGDLYDPSYGSPVFSTPLSWENASLDGLTLNRRAGWEKARLTGERIVGMLNMRTNTML